MMIGFIGLGHMGGAIVRELLRRDVAIVAYDTDDKVRRQFLDAGAKIAGSAKEVADRAETVFACLPGPAISRAVAREIADGDSIRAYAELSTIGRRTVQEIASFLAERKITLIDAPVSGGVASVEQGRLAVLLSGPSPAVEQVEAAGRLFGRTIRLGPIAGQAQLCKVVNNALNFTALLASCEVMASAIANGAEPVRLNGAIANGVGVSSASLVKIPRHILTRTFDMGGMSKGVLKDLDLYLSEAAAMGMPDGLVKEARDLWDRAMHFAGPTNDAATVARYFEVGAGADIAG